MCPFQFRLKFKPNLLWDLETQRLSRSARCSALSDHTKETIVTVGLLINLSLAESVYSAGLRYLSSYYRGTSK
jgi:hypothetical protein